MTFEYTDFDCFAILVPASAVLTFICFVYNGWIEIEFLMDAKRKLQKEWKRLCQPNRARVKSDCKPHAAADAPLAETTLKTEPSITAFFSENAGRNFTEAETRSVRPIAALSIYLSLTSACFACRDAQQEEQRREQIRHQRRQQMSIDQFGRHSNLCEDSKRGSTSEVIFASHLTD